MNRKLIAIFAALLISASLCACGGNGGSGEETTTTNRIDVGSESGSTGENESQSNENNESNSNQGNIGSEIGDPNEYDYEERNEKVYVNNPDSEVTLRSGDYVALGTVKHGEELTRIGISTDGDHYWSKVTLDDETYYIATKFVTTMKDPDEGFVAVNKTVRISDMTGSLKIRNVPTMEGSAVIGYALSGTDIKVIAENTTTEWYKIEFVNADNQTVTGYIASDAKYYEGGEKAEAGTYTDSEISFKYPENWENLGDSDLTKFNSATGDNFNIIYSDYTADMDVYFTLTKDSFKELLIPEFEAQGCTITDYTVVQEVKGGTKVAVLAFTNTMGDTTMYQTQYFFKTKSGKACTFTVTEVSEDTTIAESIYTSLTIAG